MYKKLRKSTSDMWLTGVCGGIANFFDIPSFVVRLIFIVANPVSVWIYLILAFTLEDDMY